MHPEVLRDVFGCYWPRVSVNADVQSTCIGLRAGSNVESVKRRPQMELTLGVWALVSSLTAW